MKVVTTIARILLGLVFLVFGANKLVSFMPAGPLPTGAGGQFLGAMIATKYFLVVGLCESIPGLLLLINRFVPLALTVLAAVIFNILLAGILMAPQGLPAGIVVAILWVIVFYRVRSNFAGLFEARAAS